MLFCWTFCIKILKNCTLQVVYSEGEYEEEATQTTPEPRKSRWYPSVGKAPSPRIGRAKKTVDTLNPKYHPKTSRSKTTRKKLKAPAGHHVERPRSLVMQKMDQDDRCNHCPGSDIHLHYSEVQKLTEHCELLNPWPNFVCLICVCQIQPKGKVFPGV